MSYISPKKRAEQIVGELYIGTYFPPERARTFSESLTRKLTLVIEQTEDKAKTDFGCPRVHFESEDEEAFDKGYSVGARQARLVILRECLTALGVDENSKWGWVVEREEAIIALRVLCEREGDNDWEPNLALRDIIEKHLSNYLVEE